MARNCWQILTLLAAAAPAAFSQSPAFEVASIHLGEFTMEQLHSPTIGMRIEGTRVTVHGWSLLDMIAAGYRVRTDQVSGPDWMRSQRFEIVATMPKGAKESQVPEMLQKMLAERFRMETHTGSKVASVYALLAGKGQPRMQVSAANDTSKPGCDQAVAGVRSCHRMSMEDLANLLTGISRMAAAMPPGALAWGIDFPAVDLTGLKDRYDFSLAFGPGSPGGEPISIRDAIDGLGLKLELQKRPSELIVVDKIEKLPTEN